MADNYLEKRMEDHARGRDSLHYVAARPKGTVAMRMPLRRVFAVGDIAVQRNSRIVAALASAGVKVAFAGGDYRAGSQLAQKLGARFVDTGMSDLAVAKAAEAWSGLDFLLCFEAPGQELEESFAAVAPEGRVIAVCEMPEAASSGWNAVAADSADPAQAVLFLMLPQAGCLSGVVVG